MDAQFLLGAFESTNHSQAFGNAIDRLADSDSKLSQLDACKVIALLWGYDQHWRANPWRTLAVEEVFHLPVVDPETGEASPQWTHAGKYDGRIVLQDSCRHWLLEHKTAIEQIENPHDVYWQRLILDTQVSHYNLAGWQQGQPFEGTLYDVVRKPAIRPKAIPKGTQTKKKREESGVTIGTQAELLERQTFYGFPVPREVLHAERETPFLYGLRLAYTVSQNTQQYYQRRPIPRSQDDLAEYAIELWRLAEGISEDRSSEYHPKNPDACFQYGRLCEYLPICSGEDTFDSSRWQKQPATHSELPILDGNVGASVLTNSRLKCYRACPRKHHYKYNMRVRHAASDRINELAFGSAWHLAMEGWWLTFDH